MLTQPTIHESNSLPENITVASQIDTLVKSKTQSQSLDDELIDSSINDIYESIEGDATIDFHSLTAEDEDVNNRSRLILEANNPFIEDFLNETTHEIAQEQLQGNRFDSLSFIEPTSGPSSNISNENYICKVVPTEFDLSVDNALQPKTDILDVIVPEGVEDNSVPRAVYISSKPALIAVEIGTHETSTVQERNGYLEKAEQAAPIPTLIISKICGDSPPIIVSSDDCVSLKPKKVLKAQDSLELPKDDRDKFEPTKRVDSFDLDDVDRNAKFNVKSSSEICSDVTKDLEKDSDDDFIIVTEDEVNALKIEEQDSLNKAVDPAVVTQIDDSLAKNSSISEVKAVSDDTEEVNLSLSANAQTHDIQENQKQFYASDVLELSSQPESNESINARNTFESLTKTRDSLPAIQETTTQADNITKTFTTNTTFNLFMPNQATILDSATNITQLDDQGPLPGAY